MQHIVSTVALIANFKEVKNFLKTCKDLYFGIVSILKSK